MPTAHYIPRSLLNDNGLSSLSLPSAVSSKPEASTNAGVSDARSIECETRSRNIPTINVTINVGEGMHDPTDMTTITDNTSDHVSKMNQLAKEPHGEPAEGLPTGWTRILVRRENGNYIGKDDPYYFSPMQSYKFRSLPQVKRFLVCLEEAGGDEVAAYFNFRGAEAKIKATITVEKERKIFNMDPFEADPSPVMPSITFAEPSVQPDSQGTEAVVSSQGRVGKKRKLAHTAIPGHEQALETPSAGVSSRGRQRQMSQVMADSLSQAGNSNHGDDGNEDDNGPEWVPRDNVSDDDVSSSPMDDVSDNNVSSSHMDDVSDDDVSPSRPQTKRRGINRKNTRLSTVNKHIARLEAYKAQHGHVNIPSKYNKSLFKYCSKLRTARRYPEKNAYSLKLTTEQIATLDSMGFDWKTAETGPRRKKEVSFDDRIVQLKAYKEMNGTFNVSKKDDYGLYTWCANMRCWKRGSGVGKLKPERIAALESIGFDWNPPCASHGGSRELSFETRLASLKSFKVQHGHINVSEKVDASLYRWFNHLRSARKHPEKHILKLTTDRIAALDAIGFNWGGQTRESQIISFHTRLGQLKAYKDQHGHINVSKKVDASLYRWCYNLRKARTHPEKHIQKLSPDRIAALDAIGFDWRDQQAIQFSQDPPSSDTQTKEGGTCNNEKEEIRFQYRLKQLRSYKVQHGHLNVNENEYNSLYKWCAKMRSARKYPEKYNRKLTTDHIAALDSVGFVWTSKRPLSFTDRIKQLRAYKAQHGHLNVTPVEDKSLHTWCAKMRNTRTYPEKYNRKLTTDHIAALDSVGFVWKSEIK